MKVNQELTAAEEIVLGFARNAANAKDLETGAWHLRAAQRNAAKLGTTLEAIEDKAAAIEAAKVAPAVKATPVCSVKAIRRFFAICKAQGIDTKDESHVRGALSVFFARRVASRKELTTDNWIAAGDAIEAGRLIF